MKKLPIVLLAILMVFSLFSCAEPENTPPQYVITYSGDIERSPETITAGDKYKLPADLPAKEGHKLIVKMGEIVLEAGKEYEITADTILKCNYEKLKFTLTVNNGTPQTVEYGHTYTIEKTKEGKKLVSVTVDGTKFTGDSIVIKKDTTVVYEWVDATPEKKEYTVSFAGDGITNLPKSFKVTEGDTFKLPNNLPKQEGHKLIVKMGETVLESGKEYEITADTVLNCSYEKLKFTLTIDNGTPQTVEYGDTYTILKKKDGKIMKSVKVDDKAFTEASFVIKKDTTVLYEWRDPATYTVNFAGEGITKLPDSFTVTEGNPYTLPTTLPEKENYKLVVKNGEQEIKPGTEYEISNDITLTCSWERTHYKVCFTGITRNSENVSVNTKTFKIPYIEGYYIESIKLGDEEKKPGINITVDNDITLAYTVVEGSPSLLYTDPDENGNVSVMKYDVQEYEGDIVIPNMYKGHLVTGIGYGAFASCKNLISITIPDSVTSIAESAFEYCANLTSITIPNSVTKIGDWSFTETGLSSITIPDSVTRIEHHVFNYCLHLTSITIPDGVTSIEYEAFHGCSSLTSITIPNSVRSISKKAFDGCTKLTTINVSKPESDCTDWGTGWHGATAEHQVTVKYTDKEVVYPTTTP